MSKVNYIQVDQPIGTFYVVSINAALLKGMVEVVPRSKFGDGIQRDISTKRISEIVTFCDDPDATFPTSVIINVSHPEYVKINEEDHTFDITDDVIIGEILDGQHRLAGIFESPKADLFSLPVVLMFGLTVEEQAFVFSSINSKQTKVSSSLIYDLFELSQSRSPQRTAHDIARTLNQMEGSAFYRRLKMLGKKEEDQDKATLSQGTFVSYLLKQISANPNDDAVRIKQKMELLPNDSLAFRSFFIKEEDHVILKVLDNCFKGLKNAFPKEYDDPTKSILWKSTGFGAIISTMPQFLSCGIQKKSLRVEFFESCFKKLAEVLNEDKKAPTGEFFGGGGQQVQNQFANYLRKAISLVG